MGILKKLFGRKPARKECSADDLEWKVTRVLATELMKAEAVRQPMLWRFEDDQGVFNNAFNTEISDLVLVKMKVEDPKSYLKLLLNHALGLGIYVALCQHRFKKLVQEWGQEELQMVAGCVRESDIYDLAVNALGYRRDDGKETRLQNLCRIAQVTAEDAVGENLFEEQHLKSVMQALYSAGITYAMRP